MDPSGLDELLQRARQHDPDALAELVDLYSPRLFGLFYRLTGMRDVAEDLLQETFLRVVRVIGRYEHVGKFEAWLFRIAANLARDRARQQKRHGEVSLDVPAGSSTPADWAARQDGAADPAAPAKRAEDNARLTAAITGLSDTEREVILLRHYSELSFREIAELLDVPLGTALARAHRALGHLREQLAEED